MNTLAKAPTLRSIKIAHTVIWVFSVSCILAIWVSAWQAQYAHAALMIGSVLIEVIVLSLNDWRCPRIHCRAHKFELLHPVKSEGRRHDVRCYGLQHGLAPSAWISGGAAGDPGACQICVLRQSLIESWPRSLLCVALLTLDESDDETECNA